jgi:hypothetical protein
MSVSGVSGNASQLYDSQWFQQLQQLRSQFQQLGQDLQTGNLPQAQTDFSTLSQTVSSSQAPKNDTLNHDFSNLGQALQAGNLSDAQKAFATLTRDIQQASAQRPHHHRHHHRAGGSQDAGSTGSQQNNPLAQGFDTLSQALQSGDLPGAQQAYSTLLQNLQQFGLNFGAVSNTNSTPGANLTVTA